MIFVLSHLTKGDAAYTLLQVAVNDLIILVAFAPIVEFLLGIGNIKIPLETLILSTILFDVIPLLLGFLIRNIKLRKKLAYFEGIFLKKFDLFTIIELLLTLVIFFISKEVKY